MGGGGGGNATHFKAKRAKTRKLMVPRFVSKTTCFCCCFLVCCCCCCCCFSSLRDQQALRDWLHNTSTLPLNVKVLRHAQQLQHLLRKLSPADIVGGEANYTEKCLSAFFRRQPKPVLDKCEGEIRHVGAIVFAEL